MHVCARVCVCVFACMCVVHVYSCVCVCVFVGSVPARISACMNGFIKVKINVLNPTTLQIQLVSLNRQTEDFVEVEVTVILQMCTLLHVHYEHTYT